MQVSFDPKKILTKALGRGGEFSEIFVENLRSNSIVAEENKIEKVLAGHDAGAGVRVIHGGRTVYGYSNDLTEASLLDLADAVAAAASGARAEVVDLRRREVPRGFEVRERPDTVPLDRKIDMVRRGNAAARGFGNLVQQVQVVYRDSVQDVLIANSLGELSEDRRVQTVYFVQVVAANSDGLIQTGYEPVGGFEGFEIFERMPPEDIARVAAERALGMLRATKAPAGTMPVVMSAEAGGTMVHEAVGHGLEADLAMNGLSVYTGKRGERVAAECVTVIDDGTLAHRRGSYAVDDE
ncbi:MAG: TldD/PmbA family protein, partial [Myxococcales bacterium]|nr:TldD/PmbA family protein [Myxococcales bacterium]